MKKESSEENILPPEFRLVMEEENKRNRVLIMVDALLEEDPDISTEEAFVKAMQIIDEECLNPLSEMCHNDKYDR